jgi:hypothetical protein
METEEKNVEQVVDLGTSQVVPTVPNLELEMIWGAFFELLLNNTKHEDGT